MVFLLPLVKKCVTAIAWLLAAAAAGASLFSVLELLGMGASFLAHSRLGVGLSFFCGFLAQCCFWMQLVLAALLAPWCVHVLLGRGGNEPLRLLSWTGGFLGLGVFVNKLAVTATGHSAFADPVQATVALACVLSLLMLFSFPYYQAAPPRLKRMLVIMAILTLAVPVLDSPATFLVQDAAMTVLGALQWMTARMLARAAPSIISMPSRQDGKTNHT